MCCAVASHRVASQRAVSEQQSSSQRTASWCSRRMGVWVEHSDRASPHPVTTPRPPVPRPDGWLTALLAAVCSLLAALPAAHSLPTRLRKACMILLLTLRYECHIAQPLVPRPLLPVDMSTIEAGANGRPEERMALAAPATGLIDLLASETTDTEGTLLDLVLEFCPFASCLQLSTCNKNIHESLEYSLQRAEIMSAATLCEYLSLTTEGELQQSLRQATEAMRRSYDDASERNAGERGAVARGHLKAALLALQSHTMITWRKGMPHAQCKHLGTWLQANGPLSGVDTLEMLIWKNDDDVMQDQRESWDTDDEDHVLEDHYEWYFDLKELREHQGSELDLSARGLNCELLIMLLPTICSLTPLTALK